ncbi:MAG: RtcB family protein [Nanoarchaeota archaeon]
MQEAQKTGPPKEINQISEVVWELPKSYKKGMQVPARIYATKKLLQEMDAGVFEQITNVACLPEIQKYAMCMPDGHWGYGFPIGGVAAFDAEKGVISPGGIGFDINCGMRLLTTNLTIKEVQPKLHLLVDTLFKTVPAGVGSSGFLKVNRQQFKEIADQGSSWVIKQGYGWEEDIKRTESNGCINWADSSKISEKAISRGIDQLGTLGSGNHYLEIQLAHAGNIYDEKLAKKFGIFPDQVVVMLHCGSRGFGHQVATDYLKTFLDVMPKYGLKVLDRELSCAPFQSKEGQDYYRAMACAANMAFANRQVILHRVREAFEKVFNKKAEEMDMHLVYDVAHNIAKLEEHKIDNKKVKLVVHRKGATRCFGPAHPELPKIYQETGQPVIVGGSMETGSFLCVGTKKAEEETFGSTMHGSGRTMSRTKAKHMVRGQELQKEMEKHGIYVKSVSMSGLAEEAGMAYKSINEVVDTMELAGISKKVALLSPIGNVKG